MAVETVTTCDRCGSAVPELVTSAGVLADSVRITARAGKQRPGRIYFERVGQWDLCPDCVIAFAAYLRGAR